MYVRSHRFHTFPCNFQLEFQVTPKAVSSSFSISPLFPRIVYFGLRGACLQGMRTNTAGMPLNLTLYNFVSSLDSFFNLPGLLPAS